MKSPQDKQARRRRVGMLVRVTRYADRGLLILIIITLVLSAVAGALQSLGLKIVVDAVFDHDFRKAFLATALSALGAGLVGSAGRAMSDAEHVVANRVGLIVDRNTLDLVSNMPGIAHLETPEYLDQLALVRGAGPQLMRAVFTLTRTASLGISMASALVLLAGVHPALIVLPLFAIPTAILVPRSERPVNSARAKAAERQRASTQLHRLFLAPGPAMELRVFGASDHLDERSDRLWREVTRIQLVGALRGAAIASVGWLSLTLGYVGVLWFTARLALRGEASIGDIIMVSQLALVLRGNIAETAEAARQAASALHVADRFVWLEGLHSDACAALGSGLPPSEIQRGISLEHVSFSYGDSTDLVLNDVSLTIPPGSTIAVVGNNGAGKSTLVKLLTALYQPTAGVITVDGIALTSIDPTAWRAKLTGAFQDYLRLEATAQISVGVGEPTSMDDVAHVRGALQRGGAQETIGGLIDGVNTHLGKTYADGVELSGGQWQRVAMARSMMRESPLVVILDEPSSALDPEAEQRLFESFRSRSESLRDHGTITVLVSHRFSTVRAADLIVVLDHGRIVEVGTHGELMDATVASAQVSRRIELHLRGHPGRRALRFDVGHQGFAGAKTGLVGEAGRVANAERRFGGWVTN